MSEPSNPPEPDPPSSPLDDALLERARGGDRSALQAVCNYLEPKLRTAATHRLGRLQEKVRVSDILQSTFIDIVRSAKQLPPESAESLKQWSLRVLDNNLRDLARYHTAGRRDRNKELSLDDDSNLGVAGRGHSPASELVRDEDLSRVAVAISELPQDYQRILQLFLRPDFTHESAASQLGRTVGASRVLLARARAALLTKLN